MAQSLGADVLSSNGYLKVQPTLQLLNHPEIFVVGDVVDNTEQKQSIKAAAHAGVVAGNVIAYLEGKALKPYKGSSEMIVLTLGKVICTHLSSRRLDFSNNISSSLGRRGGLSWYLVGHCPRQLVCPLGEVKNPFNLNVAGSVWAFLGPAGWLMIGSIQYLFLRPKYSMSIDLNIIRTCTLVSSRRCHDCLLSNS